MTGYDALYRGTGDYFGDAPALLLERFVDRIGAGRHVLDIGIGQGRNALYLAKKGYHVTGIDPSAEAIRTVAERARTENVTVELLQAGFSDFEATTGAFDAVLVFGLLQDLPRNVWPDFLDRLDRWTEPGGIPLLTAWHVDDPSRAVIARSWRGIGKNSFREPTGSRVRSYLEPGEIAELLGGWKVIDHWEGIGPEHRHGDGPLERHGVVEVVAERA